jgi:phospholipid/cholesterol/gamma-HCH transport system substrate-binding protein
MTRNTIETVMGAVVLLVAGVFLWLAYAVTDIRSSDGAIVSAEFGAIGSLNVGDDVRLSGIKIGKVVETELNVETFGALVTMSLDERISLPTDSTARIAASSLLGGSFIDIIPGFEETYIADGDSIYDTRDPVNLTDLLGKAVFSGGSDDGAN